ncbi:MAG: type II CAAX endopeptidase family protein [Terracidiphilus sp.]|jgi:membrane protease YdiL (CAAX protease family)
MQSNIRPSGVSVTREATRPERAAVLWYLLVVFITTTAIAACFPLLHITDNWVANALGFLPGIIAIPFFLLRHERIRSIGWGIGNPFLWLWAILFPVAIIAVTLPLTLRLGYAAIAPLTTSAGRVAHDPMRILHNILLYTAIAIPFAFGEELGWRGYAQGKLVREFGLVKGLLILGLVWGFWHSPIYYFTGAYAAHPILGPLIMTPVDNLLVVVPMAWLYIRSRTIWVPVLTHAFADVLWGFSDLLYPKSHELQSWAILQCVQLLVSIALLIDLKRRPNNDRAASTSGPVVPGEAATH